MGPLTASRSASACLEAVSSRWSNARRTQQTFEQEPGAAEAAALARERVLRWCAIAGLAWRALAYPPALLQGLSEAHASMPSDAAVLIVAVLIGNLAVLAHFLWHGFKGFLQNRWFCAVDISIAVCLNLWSSIFVAPKSILTPGRDVFAVYGWDTVVLWTTLRGPLFGFLLCLSFTLPLILGMALLNGYNLATIPWEAVAPRSSWTLAHFLIAMIVVIVAREAAWATAGAALRAGREAERAEVLRRMHDTVLQTLEGIVLQASQTQTPAEDRLQAVSITASRQAIALRAVLQEDHEAPSSLATRLRTLTEEFIASDLRVELVLSEIVDLEPQEPIREALAGAIREALNNVAKHSGAQHAVVRATPSKEGIRVTIRDHGHGFVGNAFTHGVGLRGSVIERMQRVSGTAEVWSQPGAGTRVTLWAPLSSASE